MKLPDPPPGPRPRSSIPFWDRHSTWMAISWIIVIGGLLVYNLGGLWGWSFFR